MMSKADKMLEELGFARGDDGDYPTYRKENITIMFDIDSRDYEVSEYVCAENRRQSVYINVELHKAIAEKMKELGWVNNGVPPLKIKDEEFGKDFPEEFADEVWYSCYCGNEGCTNSATFGPWDKYCSECGTKIDWNSHKAQESEVK